MKISQLLLKVTDFSSGLSIEQNYLLNAYSTKEKAQNGMLFFKNEVFKNLIELYNDIQEEKSRIIFQAQKTEDKYTPVEQWKNKELKNDFYKNRKRLDIFMQEFFPYAKPSVYALINNHSDFEVDFDIIEMELL